MTSVLSGSSGSGCWPLAHGGCVVVAQRNCQPERIVKRAIAITLVAGLVRLIIAALTPLFPDETYYWEWSRHLATGYFDHPPMIAWLIRAGTLLAGDTPLGVRLFPVIAGVVAGLCICSGTRRLAGQRAAMLAAI